MKKSLINLMLLSTFPFLFSSALIDNLRFSAPIVSNDVVVRGELDFFYDVSFYTLDDTGQNYYNFDLIEGSLNNYEGLLPAPINGNVNLGIRAYNDVISETYAGVAVQPIPWNGVSSPQVNNLNWLGNDASNDSAVDETFLDIIATNFTYDDEKMYFGIENNGGGFPVSEAIWGPFYSYLSLIVPSGANIDPENLSVTPFGLLYTVNQTGIIQPGLYKINGLSMDDIELIGSIETTIDEENNQLIFSCNWSDLYAQTEFMEWFDQDDPKFDTASGTGMITLSGGLQDADFTYPVAVYLDQLTLEQEENTLPEIVNIIPNGYTGYLTFTYYDADGNFPLSAYALVDGDETIEFEPQSLDFSTEVIFMSNQPSELLMENWDNIIVTISDNDIDFVENTAYPVSNNDTEPFVDSNYITNYPNPFNPETTISFNLDSSTPVKIVVYNIKGQKVVSLADKFYSSGRHEIVWDGKNDNKNSVSSGIYYVQMQTDTKNINHKMILLK